MIINPPSPIERLITKAKLAYPDTTFSNSFPYDPATVEKVQETFRFGPTAQAALSTTTNVDIVTQFIVLLDGKAKLITRPFHAAEDHGTEETVCIGSLGDAVGRVCPIKIPTEYFMSEFATLTREATAVQFGLKKLNQPPDTIPGPTMVNEEGGEELTPPSMARLQFNVGDNEEEIQPVIALLPTCLPLPIGVHFPKEGIPMGEQNLEVNANYPFFPIWQQGINYVLNHNQGKSVTEGGALFNIGSIEKQPFQGRSITADVNAVITPLLPGTALYDRVEASIHALERSVWIRLSERLPIESTNEEQTANPANQNPTQPNSVQELLSGLMRGLQQPRNSLTEAEQLSQAEQYIQAMSIIGARLEDDPDQPGKMKVVPAETTDLFNRIAKASSVNTAKN
jgi:hypothetical protein